jgi:hypothetical protein
MCGKCSIPFKELVCRFQTTCKKLRHVRRFQRVFAVAIHAAESTAAGLHQHKSHRLPALAAIGRWDIFCHGTHAQSGARVLCSQSPFIAVDGPVMFHIWVLALPKTGHCKNQIRAGCGCGGQLANALISSPAKPAAATWGLLLDQLAVRPRRRLSPVRRLCPCCRKSSMRRLRRLP